VSTNAIQPSGDSLLFAKESGPAWLSVAANGALSGTPTAQDIGTNTFAISLSVASGWTNAAIMIIPVIPGPLMASVSLSQSTNVLLSWTGGEPPYVIQSSGDLAHPVWQNLGPPTTNTSLLITPSNVASFYRIQSQ
jgi:hypothetical protein